MSLPLHLRAQNSGLTSGLFKVLDLKEALQLRFAPDRVLVDLRDDDDVLLESLAAFGFAGALVSSKLENGALPHLHSLSIDAAVGPGDAIRIGAGSQVNVLYRRGANANTLFVTEMCNSLCLMCSQPPREFDDSWRIQELIELLPFLDKDLSVLGVTGGEPTLLGMELARLLIEARRVLPGTHLHVLSNGRAFASDEFADRFQALSDRVTWAVPVYSDISRVHDYVVQAPGAFVETINGLHNLAERGHRIEIRTVLHAQTLPRIVDHARFIVRNLPFASHVALMGLEPIGFARRNMSILEVNLSEVSERIVPAVSLLDQAGMNVSIYNLPLCALDPNLRRFARKSISDWKNEFAEACRFCAASAECCGFFRSAPMSWRESVARPLLGEVA